MTQRKLSFMFLGGRLDHTIRYLAVEGPLLTPPEQYVLPETIARTGQTRIPGHPMEHQPRETYHRTRCTTGHRTWWCYILEGYAPPRRDILDANPFFL